MPPNDSGCDPAGMRAERSLTPDDRAAAGWVEVAFDVPIGCGGFTVDLALDDPTAVIDLGLTGPAGWIGYSGGARRRFTVTDDAATPGYCPGVTTGRHAVVLGLHRIPAAGVRCSVTVDLDSAAVEPPPPRPPLPTGRPTRPELPTIDGMRFLAGDLHAHSTHSDGAEPLAAVIARAAAAGLDFLAATEHNTVSHHPLLPDLGRWAGLTVLPGQEVTTWRGHANAFGDIGWVDFRRPADDWLAGVTARGGLLSVNHPLAADCAWRWPLAAPPPLLETWHTSWQRRTDGGILAFRQAFAPAAAPIGGSDFHRPGDAPPGSPTTWVLADSPSVAGILAGLRAGRTAVNAGFGHPLLLRCGDELLALAADGLLLADPAGRRRVVHGDRVRLPAAPGMHWLEDGRTAVQALCG